MRLALGRSSPKRPLQVLITTVRMIAKYRASVRVLILATDPDRTVHFPDAILRHTYGLTPAETEIANALLTGFSLEEIAQLRKVSIAKVKARTGQEVCKLKGADADTLTCTHGRDFTFQRSYIVSIKISRRGRSALIGAAIGGSVGTGIGFAAGTTGKDTFFGPNFLRGAMTAIGADFGGVVGGATGALTDFSHSTMYNAP